jgi:hypothetical protein
LQAQVSGSILKKESAMRGVILAAVVSTFAVVGGVAMVPGAPDVDENLIVSSITRDPARLVTGETLMVSNNETGDICLLERRPGNVVYGDIVVPASDCDAVWPGLGGAGKWIEGADGRIVLEGAMGVALMTLSAADGMAFEAIEPARAMITLSSLE